jgi:hypothetical protein
MGDVPEQIMNENIRTTEQDWEDLPASKRLTLTWVLYGNGKWQADVQGETTARIHRLDPQTFTCYRGTRYLGSEATVELAKKRVDLGEKSHSNREAARGRGSSSIPPQLMEKPK